MISANEAEGCLKTAFMAFCFAAFVMIALAFVAGYLLKGFHGF